MSSSIHLNENDFQIVFLNEKDSQVALTSSEEPFLLLNQVHGNKVVQQPASEILEADGHFTNQDNLKLGIKTADCLPIMIADTKSQVVCSLHAGWKGVALNIVSVGVKKLIESGSDTKNLKVWIGPHIQFESFEIEKPTLNEILDSIKKSSIELNKTYKQTSETKYLLNLKKVVEAQFSYFQITPDQIWTSEIDTKTNIEWASFRRDRIKNRNLSFISFKS